jgi:hypothetical protein
MVERRSALRNPTYLGGTIRYNGGLCSVTCIVRNFSHGGAKLAFHNTAFVPDTFEIDIPRKGLTLRGDIRWRRLDAAGIALMPLSDGTASLEQERRLRRLARENGALRSRIEQADGF